MRRAVWIVAVAALLSGCAGAYPMPSGPPHAGQSQPARVGEPVTAVLIFLEVHPGDRIEFLGPERDRPTALRPSSS